MKKVLRALVIGCMAFCLVSSPNVYAEDHPYSDTNYWNDYCTTKGNTSTSACKAYIEYLNNQTSASQDRLEQIEADREKIAENISEYTEKLQQLETEIEQKQAEIDAMQAKINNKQVEIDAKQVQIDATQAQVEALEEKVKNRMVSSQATMHFNQYLDILMGASSFQDLLRIASGLVSITQYDEKTLNDLEALRNQLSVEKQELQDAKADLEATQQILLGQQRELEEKQAEHQVILEEFQKQDALLMAEGENVASNIDAIQDAMQKLAEAGTLDGVATAAGWTYPVPGARISAGTWAYPGGGLHLGEDFAAPVGTPVLAAGNGVVMNSANGCPTYGGLGNMCGGNIGGALGGGNQAQVLVSVNNSLYVVNYNHMMLDSVIAAGTVVTSGMQIGMVGSSGNSSGPHCHIEVYYLGDASNFSTVASTWNGDISFGTSWGYSARKCDAGYGAPCRLRPETIFGG